MRRAFIVGIDDYENEPLNGCVNDANRIAGILEYDFDRTPNFSCAKLISSEVRITRTLLKRKIEHLFREEADVALFYFSGHGTVNNLGGYLVTQDATAYDEGVSMTNVLQLANDSSVREVIIILDCCYSGAFGQPPFYDNKQAILKEGVSILTASRESQGAVEIGGEGLFTSLICDGLEGGAADLVGDVTVASLYAYVDQALGPWDQRPLFKAHISKLLKVRRASPSIEPQIVRLLSEYFKSPNDEYSLSPDYEPTHSPGKYEDLKQIFGHLQKYNRQGLVVPIEVNNMFDAAMKSKSCKLTARGRFYWRVVSSNRI